MGPPSSSKRLNDSHLSAALLWPGTCGNMRHLTTIHPTALLRAVIISLGFRMLTAGRLLELTANPIADNTASAA